MNRTTAKIAPTSAPTVTATPLSGTPATITTRERSAIVKSLAAGLVPAIGLHHLVVGRKREIQALLQDLDSIKDGGAGFRVIIGDYGAGKTFLEHLIQGTAIQENFVVLSADLTINHRLYGDEGRSRALFSSLMANVHMSACPLGKGLRLLMEAWISSLAFESDSQAAAPEIMAGRINQHLRSLKDFPGGFEFATVLAKYYEGHVADNPALQDAALRWLRAEYSTKLEARKDLGVRRIIGDEDIYGALKLFAAFCKLAGYSGLLVVLDELTALTHRLSLAKARQANVQVLLTIINECFQGGVSGLGFILAGAPESLTDPERGLFSIPALRSRLQPSSPEGCIDLASPVLRLEPLAQEDLLVLLHNIRRVHAGGDETKYGLSDEALETFLDRALSRFGRKTTANSRDVVRRFVSLLNVLEQEPDRGWEELMDRALASAASDPAERQLEELKLA